MATGAALAGGGRHPRGLWPGRTRHDGPGRLGLATRTWIARRHCDVTGPNAR